MQSPLTGTLSPTAPPAPGALASAEDMATYGKLDYGISPRNDLSFIAQLMRQEKQ